MFDSLELSYLYYHVIIKYTIYTYSFSGIYEVKLVSDISMHWKRVKF